MGIRKTIIKYNPINKIRQKKERSRLKHNISIFASDCMGGILYHDLGQKFLSPTVNIRFDSPDFVKFVCNIEHYLQQDLVFFVNDEPFPVAKLDDITLHFVHYHTNKEAEDKWKERISRIEWDKSFFITNDNDGMNENDYLELDNCKFPNILVFTAKDLKHRCTFQLKQYAEENEVGVTLRRSILTGKMNVQQCFDFVSWFNQEKGQDLENYRIK